MTRARATADTQDNNGGSVAPFVAGKNRILNSDFSIWQRGTTFNSAANTAYTADRFQLFYNGTGATRNISQQAFTVGAAPVAGYEGQFFYRYAQTVAGTGGTFSNFGQKIEDVRTFAGQTATFSFWARVSSGTISVDASSEQNFGSGGSSSVFTQFGSSFTITTSWQRFSGTVTIPSISGRTIGSGNFLYVYLSLPNNTTFTLDTWGWQLEAGSVATPFTTATGNPASELAACQRYYWRTSNTGYGFYGLGYAELATQLNISFKYPVTMRTTPAISSSAAGNLVAYRQGGFVASTSVLWFNQGNADQMLAYCSTAAGSLTQFSPYVLFSNNTSSFVEFSSEL